MSDINVGDFVGANIYGNRYEYGEIQMILDVPLAHAVGSIRVYVVNGFIVQLDRLELRERQP